MHGENRAYTRFGAYCDSKLANVLFTKEIVARYGPSGIVSAAVHPGIVNTKLFRHIVPQWVMEEKEKHPERDRLLAKYLGVRSPDDGALGAVWLATEANAVDIQGKYYNGPHDERVPATATNSTVLSKSLWDASEVLILRALKQPVPDDLLQSASRVIIDEPSLDINTLKPGPGAGVGNFARMMLTTVK